MILAQVNIAQLVAPEGDSRVADFFAQVPEINALAESSDGFIWRYEGEYPDPMVAFNMSVWSSLESLRMFVYRSNHVHVLRRKKEWFLPMNNPHMAMWWIDEGCLPTPDEALIKLFLIEQQGSSIDAFTFAQTFPAPN